MRVEVHSNHLLPLLGKRAADAPGPASGIQDPAASDNHRVNGASFPENILAFCSKRAPALGKIRRVVRVLANGGEPKVFFWCSHESSFALSLAFGDWLAPAGKRRR